MKEPRRSTVPLDPFANTHPLGHEVELKTVKIFIQLEMALDFSPAKAIVKLFSNRNSIRSPSLDGGVPSSTTGGGA